MQLERQERTITLCIASTSSSQLQLKSLLQNLFPWWMLNDGQMDYSHARCHSQHREEGKSNPFFHFPKGTGLIWKTLRANKYRALLSVIPTCSQLLDYFYYLKNQLLSPTCINQHWLQHQHGPHNLSYFKFPREREERGNSRETQLHLLGCSTGTRMAVRPPSDKTRVQSSEGWTKLRGSLVVTGVLTKPMNPLLWN